MDDVIDYQKFTSKKSTKLFRQRMNVGDIWSNSVKCLNCDEIIRSKNQHDFIWCKCHNVAVDGGSWYLKRVGGENGYEELSEVFDDAKENRPNET